MPFKILLMWYQEMILHLFDVFQLLISFSGGSAVDHFSIDLSEMENENLFECNDV